MGVRILVVDDEEDTLTLLRTILQLSGFDPVTTLNSVEAIGLAESQKPDVVLLDIMMPRLDGFTLCKMMRANLATRTLPIIFVTAYEALDLDERRLEAGGDLVVRKPINIDELVESIHSILKKRATPPVPASAPAPAPIPAPAAVPAPAAPVSAVAAPSDGSAAATQEASKVEPASPGEPPKKG